MATPPARDRRTLVLSAVAGVIAGSAWGATIQALARPSAPSLSIIGKREMQVVLLDTTRLRILVLLGTPDDDLQAQIPALLTMLRQRIDILVGTLAALDAVGPEFQRRWRVTHTFVLPGGKPNWPNTPEKTWINQDVGADLGDGVWLDFSLTTRDAWDAAATPRELWAVSIKTQSLQVALAPDPESALVLAEPGVTLVVVPQGRMDRLLATLLPASIAMNARDDLELPAESLSLATLVRIYPRDIARFEFHEDGIALPTWAEGNS